MWDELSRSMTSHAKSKRRCTCSAKGVKVQNGSRGNGEEADHKNCDTGLKTHPVSWDPQSKHCVPADSPLTAKLCEYKVTDVFSWMSA